MKQKRFSVEQIAYAITQAENGTVAAAICRDVASPRRVALSLLLSD